MGLRMPFSSRCSDFLTSVRLWRWGWFCSRRVQERILETLVSGCTCVKLVVIAATAATAMNASCGSSTSSRATAGPVEKTFAGASQHTEATLNGSCKLVHYLR